MISQASPTQQDPAQELLMQIKQLMQQYLALPGDTPMKPVFSGLMDQMDAVTGGDAGMGSPLPEGAGDVASQMAPEDTGDIGTALEGQGHPDISEPSQDEAPAKDYGTARDRALSDMKNRAKSDLQQPKKRKRRG